MKQVMRQAYSEVNEILKYLPKEKIEKIPQKYMFLFQNCGLEGYKPMIDPNKPINEQKVVHETLVILTILKYNYWCSSDEERRKMEEKMKANDRKNAERYDISKLNNRVAKTSDVNMNVNLPAKIEKQNWFSKIIDKIKNLFKH